MVVLQHHTHSSYPPQRIFPLSHLSSHLYLVNPILILELLTPAFQCHFNWSDPLRCSLAIRIFIHPAICTSNPFPCFPPIHSINTPSTLYSFCSPHLVLFISAFLVIIHAAILSLFAFYISVALSVMKSKSFQLVIVTLILMYVFCMCWWLWTIMISVPWRCGEWSEEVRANLRKMMMLSMYHLRPNLLIRHYGSCSCCSNVSQCPNPGSWISVEVVPSCTP